MEFREIDVSQDQEAARDVVRRTGQLGVPVIADAQVDGGHHEHQQASEQDHHHDQDEPPN